MMILLGIYILGKGGGLLLGRPAVQKMVSEQEWRRRLEDAVTRTLMPGYTAAVEGRTAGWMVWLMEPTVPVYSYLAERMAQNAAGGQKNSGEKSGAEGQTGIAQGEKAAERSQLLEEHKAGNYTRPEENTEEVTHPEENIAEEATHPEEQIPEEAKLPEETVPEENPEKNSGRVDAQKEEKNVSDQKERSGEKRAEEQEAAAAEAWQPTVSTTISPELYAQLSDYQYLLNQYFTVDAGTAADEQLLDASKLLTENLSIRQNPQVPQILIYHTHSQELFADSVPGDTETSIVGMGEVLAEALRGYGYQVIHDTGVYDLVDGVLDRSAAYDYAREAVEAILEQYPTIEVVIDLHRDGVEGQKFVTTIDGKPTSMIMFFNGISRNSQDEPLAYLANPYIRQNLAFSLQLELAAREKYPGYTRNIYLKAERFNLHLRPRSLLVEAGTQLNTVEEEQNAMQPLAELLHEVLDGRNA